MVYRGDERIEFVITDTDEMYNAIVCAHALNKYAGEDVENEEMDMSEALEQLVYIIDDFIDRELMVKDDKINLCENGRVFIGDDYFYPIAYTEVPKEFYSYVIDYREHHQEE